MSVGNVVIVGDVKSGNYGCWCGDCGCCQEW